MRTKMETKTRKRATTILLALGLSFAGKVIGGHPLLVNAVQDTLKNWKYAAASSETTVSLEFSFHP